MISDCSATSLERQWSRQVKKRKRDRDRGREERGPERKREGKNKDPYRA